MMSRERAVSAPLRHGDFSSPEEIIEDVRNGRMIILIDDEDRESEGDLIIPAQMVTPEKINFMAKHGRGLICLAMTRQRIDELGLELMSHDNGTRHETAFTVSIEAREGVTTGISAADRARTVAAAIDSNNGPDGIVTPGHVFPLVARDGGVLVRAGHTEAAVDIARLAGLNPSGVICEIMNEDGTMARVDDLLGFATRHALKIGTIRDLIAYRLSHDHLVERAAQRSFTSDYGGEWQALVFRNRIDRSEHIVLQKGRVQADVPTLVRVHAVSLLDDLLGRPGSRRQILQRAMLEIGCEGAGIIVVLKPNESEGSWRLAEGSESGMDLRSYGIGAQILSDLGVQDMVLLTTGHRNIVGLDAYGLNVVGERALPGECGTNT
jgi:3,4-dihydroxy 2-butanone 4-phosphate synthase/GTP cyclohydrolase II